MFNQEIFAVSFGRAVMLLRANPEDRDQQVAAVRAVHALTSVSSASVRVYDGALSIDDVGIAPNLPTIPELVTRIQEHGLAEITIARGAPPSDLIALLRTLAADPDRRFNAGTMKRRLGKASAACIVVLPAKALEEVSGRRSASVSGAFEFALLEDGAAAGAVTPAAPPAPAAAAAPPAEVVTAAPSAPVAAAVPPAPESQAAVVAPPAPPSAPMPPLETSVAGPPAPGAAAGPAPAAEEAAPAEVVPADWLAEAGVTPDSALGAALQAVTLDPYGATILDRLSVLSRAVAKALEEDDVEHAVRVLAVVVSLEPGAPEGTPRSSYVITLRRMLTRPALTQMARLAADQRLAPAAAAVLRRGAGDAMEVLLELLSTAQSIRERKAIMNVLRGMQSGTERALNMLYDDEWFVVRNVAELVGELRLEDAVPRLAELLEHRDARVRRTAAVALAKVGSVATVEPLRRVLREGEPELRALVASSMGGPHARALAMPLAAHADTESEPVVLAECYRALGRIGTPESIQALARAAQSSGKLLRRRPAAVRVAAVEGLAQAGGPVALRTLETLRQDSDKAVRAAAEKALAAGPK